MVLAREAWRHWMQTYGALPPPTWEDGRRKRSRGGIIEVKTGTALLRGGRIREVRWSSNGL